MTDLDQMSANLRAISLAVAASDGSPEELFSFLEETGYPPLDICRFILTSSETEMKRIMFVRVVGFFFDYLTRMDFDAIFSEGWAMGINPYSYIFAYRGGGTPSRIPRPFMVKRRFYLNFHRDCNSSSLPWLQTPLFVDSLPSGLVFPWGVEMTHCWSLSRIGNCFEAGGPIHIHHCGNLCRLPSDLIARKGMKVHHLPALSAIPSGISVDGDLDLSHLPSLSRHGTDIRVRGTLKIRNCPEFRRIHPWLEADRLDLRL